MSQICHNVIFVELLFLHKWFPVICQFGIRHGQFNSRICVTISHGSLSPSNPNEYRSVRGYVHMKEPTIGTLIKSLREKHNLTQQQLADMLNITQAPISRWENGEREISLPMMRRIAEVFNLSFTDFIDLAEKNYFTDNSPVNIIVIEDVEAELNGTVSMLKKCLSERDVSTVIGFSHAQEAIDHCNENRVDMVFLDVELDGKPNGLELAGTLKSIDPRMKVIILTAYPEYASDAWELHSDNIVDGYLLKPLTPKRLAKEINRFGTIMVKQDSLKV